ncbi:MAG: CBS domain-containing protein [Candidatus Omnitrophica bacterium]|nr:CBS domain-containing protein [Candidatus Omnitrophota bacterium]
MLNLPISEIMNDHPIKVKSDVTVRNVAHLLLRIRINGILVMDVNEPDKLIGVFTMRDLLHLMGDSLAKRSQKMQALHDVGGQPVGNFIKDELLTLEASDNAAKAVALMHKKDAITIPVMANGKLVGVIGRHDIINIAFA